MKNNSSIYGFLKKPNSLKSLLFLIGPTIVGCLFDLWRFTLSIINLLFLMTKQLQT